MNEYSLAKVGWTVGQPVLVIARATAEAKTFALSPPALSARAAETAAACSESPPPALTKYGFVLELMSMNEN